MSSRSFPRAIIAPSSRLTLVMLAVLSLGACATVPRREALPPEAEAARALLERRWQAFGDLRTLATVEIKRGQRTDRLSGALLLRTPTSLRFEALSPLGPPFMLVGVDGDGVTIWEVLKNRAYRLPSTPEANRRWLGLSLGSEDLVALLSGHVVPLKEPLAGQMLPPDEIGASLSLRGADGDQRIWLDPQSGQARQVEWTGGKNPLRVTFTGGGRTEPATGLRLATLDGKLEVRVRYEKPRMDTGFDPGLLKVSVPQGVEIQDFR